MLENKKNRPDLTAITKNHPNYESSMLPSPLAENGRSNQLTVEQAAKHFKLSAATLRKKIQANEIEAFSVGRQYRFTWASIWACESGHLPRIGNHARYKENLLAKLDIALALQISVRTVERWIFDGMPTRNVFGSVRLNPHDVTDWLRGRHIDLPDGWWH